MAGNCKSSASDLILNLDHNIHVVELALSYIWKELMDTPQSEKRLLSRLKRISPEAKKEYLNFKKASTCKTRELIEDKAQNYNTTKVSYQEPPSHATSSSSSSGKSDSSRLFLLGKKIMSENSKSSDSDNDINVAISVLSYILDALMKTPQGKRRFLSVLQRISQAKADYMNKKGASIPKIKTVFEDEPNNCDITKASHQVPPADPASVTSTRRKTKATIPCLLNKNFMVKAENISRSHNSNDINVGELVLGYVWDDLKDTPQGEKQFLLRLQRISLQAKEEYLKIKAASTHETEGLEVKSLDCGTTKTSCPTHAASASIKSKASFEHVCEKLFPGCKLPEGLLLAQSIYCAKAGLSFYNVKHGTDYKLVEPLSSARHIDRGIRFHSNFTAVKLTKNGSHAAQLKLFYADFRCSKKKVRDMHCCIIDAAKARFHCCVDCPPDLAHCDQRSTYFLPHSYKYSPKELEARKNQFCAKTALDFYNDKHGTKYKLVKSLESNIVPISFGVYQFHCNFRAKLENTSSSDDASPRLFFAGFVKSTTINDVDCCILDTTEGLDDHCSICRKGIFHPAHYKSSVNLHG